MILDLDKLRNLPQNKITVNPFKTLLTHKDAKDILIQGMNDILRELYYPLFRYNKRNISYGVYGVFDYEYEDKKWVQKWSCINFFNTNYSMLYYTLNHLEKKYGISIDRSLSVVDFAQEFMNTLYQYKEEIFLDGVFKDELCRIQSKTWNKGESYNNYVVDNYTEFWPGALDFINESTEKGMSQDLNGKDGSVVFESGVEHIQTKGCLRVEKVESEYYVWCVVDLSKYTDITYFCFFPSNENKFYIFYNREGQILNDVDEMGRTIVRIDEESFYGEYPFNLS